MFITPIKPMEVFGLPGETGERPVSEANSAPFRDMVMTALENLKETETQSAEATAALASGTVDDLHTLGILNTKAYIAERMVIEVRNRTLEAYSELMRINL